jgi:glycosyltransferase involved in cell wall biosynthesis
MLKILVLTRYDSLGASSRVRFLQFLSPLSTRGISFTVQPFLDNDYICALYSGKRPNVLKILIAYLKRFRVLLRARSYDLLWMEKEALPWLPAALELALLRGISYVVDLDDAWFHRYDQSPWAIIRKLMAGKIDRLMDRAAVVVAGNQYLADRARSANAKRVEIIPSVIDLNRYRTKTISKNSDRKNTVVIGWIGTPVTARYLAEFEQAFRTIAAIRSVKLHVVGASAPLAFAGLPVATITWNEATEVDAIRAFDIGIMPLDNTPWERGKCAYKLLQVMAAGRPVVASSVGANRTVIRDGINGFLVDTTDTWIAALTALIDDPNLRATMGREAMQAINEQYSIERATPRLAAVLSEAAALRH